MELTARQWDELQGALRERIAAEHLAQASWWWRVRNWRSIRQVRREIERLRVARAVNQTMQLCGLDPAKHYQIDPETRTVTDAPE